MKAAPYFTSYEEEIVLFHEGTLIEGDIRAWLKKHEVDKALKNWKALKVSGQLIRRFPKQIPILAKEIWRSSIHSMDGVAWIYFIFAVCHRLPTNLQKHKFLNPEMIRCNLCQCCQTEDEEHLFVCPALAATQDNLREAMDRVFRKWDLPYSNTGIPAGIDIKETWSRALRDSFTQQHRFHPTLRLTESKIRQLVDDYWNGNPDNRHKSLQDLRKNILYCIKRYDCRCGSRHTCQLRNCWSTPHALLEILQKHLHLEVEGMSDSLHHSMLFGTWISAYKSDKSFGALFDIFTQPLSGRNTYINPPFNNLGTQENAISRIIKKIAEDLKADKPTRAVLLIPIFEGMDGHVYETQVRKAKFLEIGTFPAGSFCFVAPEAFSIDDDFTPGPFKGKVGLYLAANKFSLKIDPIDWDTLTSDINMWSQTACRKPMTICLSTVEKFKQRVPLEYQPRVPSFPYHIQHYKSSNIYHYYDFSIKRRNEFEHLKKYIKDGNHLRLLNRMNSHDRFAAVLGILPNQLIRLVRETKPEDKDVILKDLRLTSFWHGYRVWQQRMYFNREYWRDKAPTIFKGKPDVLDNCVNPFHYLKLVNPKQAPSLGTCNCSAQLMLKKKKRKLPDVKNNTKIDDWLIKVRVVEEKKSIKICTKPEATNSTENSDHIDLSGLDHKYLPANTNPKDFHSGKNLRIRTSSEVVLEEQDRKKRLKIVFSD
jgi:hypothetical protein